MIPATSPYAGNLRLYGWIKLLTKRVYLPIITVYLVEVGHLNLAQISLLVTISAATALVAGIPTGYFADRVTRKAALITGAVLLCLATGWYIFLPTWYGAIVAAIVEATGFSFISGAGEALMHDTLVAMGQGDSYVRVMGRAQSFGLVGNTVLVGLVPLTYNLDKRLPFICGTIATVIFITLTASLHEPPRHTATVPQSTGPLAIISALRGFIRRRSLLFFMSLGLLSGLYSAYAPFNNLVFKDLGLDPALFGLAYASGSIVGAVGGRFIHILERFSLLRYSLIDTALLSATMVVVGLTRNLPLSLLVFLITLGFWRLRNIIYQHHLLRRFPGAHKATLISAMSFFDNASELWLPFVFSGIISLAGYYNGYLIVGLGTWAVLSLMFIWSDQELRRLVVPSTTPLQAPYH